MQRDWIFPTCEIAGHDWKHTGGRNAGCELGGLCCCSVPVRECRRCGECDYGENEEAVTTLTECAARKDEIERLLAAAVEAAFFGPAQKPPNTALRCRPGGGFETVDLDDAGNPIEPCPDCGPFLKCSKHMGI